MAFYRSILAGAFSALATASSAAAPAPMIQAVIKFVKEPGSKASPIHFDPASCKTCVPISMPGYNTDNPRETVIALQLPRMRSLELSFTGSAKQIRRILLEAGDLPYRQEGSKVVVQVPPLSQDAITAAEYSMHIVEPGMVLRLEHDDPVQRAGDYTTGRFPDVERRAADTLEFAQREVVRLLGLGVEAKRDGLGVIQIMGFDTNDPHGHRDSPPHFHMHLRWPGNSGTQIGHFYLGPDGLITHNDVYLKGFALVTKVPNGKPATTIGPNGKPVYSHTVTQEGWLELGRAGEQPCLIKPLGQGGFETGASVACPGREPISIRVEHDHQNGVVRVHTDDIEEVFRYDLDTGALTSPAKAPAPGPSIYVEPD